jgi:hypothetical protein
MITTSSGMSSLLFSDQLAKTVFDLRMAGKAQVPRDGTPDDDPLSLADQQVAIPSACIAPAQSPPPKASSSKIDMARLSCGLEL